MVWYPRGLPSARFAAKVQKHDDGCWVWAAYVLPNGYGTFWAGGVKIYAHRFSYELHNGPIPEGLDIDHLCRNRACVNPAHLEAVSRRENLLRGNTLPAHNAAKTHCSYGHPFSDENTGCSRGHRYCRICSRRKDRKRYYALKAAK